MSLLKPTLSVQKWLLYCRHVQYDSGCLFCTDAKYGVGTKYDLAASLQDYQHKNENSNPVPTGQTQ